MKILIKWIHQKSVSLITVDLIGQKELDVDPKAIKQIEFVGQLKEQDNNGKTTNADNKQFMFV